MVSSNFGFVHCNHLFHLSDWHGVNLTFPARHRLGLYSSDISYLLPWKGEIKRRVDTR